MRTIAAFLVPFLFAASAFAQDNVDTRSIDREMQKILKAEQLQGARVGIYAKDVESGEVLYAREENDSFNPASNAKLITAAAVLDVLGPEYVFGTRLSVESVSGDTVKGPLYVKSEGDPLLLWEDFLSWASELKAMGITKIDGGIVVDDTEFDDTFIPPGFDQKDEDACYRAPTGALSVNFNCQTVVVRPGERGKPAQAYLLPPNDHVEFVNDASTSGGSGVRLTASSETTDGGTKIKIGGTIGQRAEPQYLRKRIDNPSLFSGAVLAAALKTAGIEVAGEVRRGERPGGTKTLIYHRGKPLSYTVFLMNKWSNNFMAEMLFRALGRDDGIASAKRSPGVVNDYLKKAGIQIKGFTSFNGSGLYDGNQVTPKQIVELLDFIADQPMYPEYAAALAVAGTDGTLTTRLGGSDTKGTLRGKTGTLNNVTALSGYLRTESGRTVAYSILINDPPVRAWRLRRIQDEMAEAIADFDK